ncbi:hypothetical protein EVA_13779 [gut metagenome]|uniref:Uncharacterized protein n=1 Tax=gut metagenome TaxID=749906 RepID=J9GFK3_9ZZZZ
MRPFPRIKRSLNVRNKGEDGLGKKENSLLKQGDKAIPKHILLYHLCSIPGIHRTNKVGNMRILNKKLFGYKTFMFILFSVLSISDRYERNKTFSRPSRSVYYEASLC